MNPILSSWNRCEPATRLSLVAVFAAFLNPWLGLVIGLSAAGLFTRKQQIDFGRHLSVWYFLPVFGALCFVGVGESLPSDDLMRNLSAWQLNFDYRTQYPWSDIPRADMWLGFDYLLGLLQQAGLSKTFLLQWIPGASLALQSVVLFGALRRQHLAHRHNASLLLIVGALGLVVLTPRSLLGRPEMFLLTFGMSAWLCRTRAQSTAWVVAFLALIPFYWLGWVYAPCALLLVHPHRLVARVGLVAVLGVLHVAFWQVYTGDYLGTMVWLKGTLSVLAAENAPMLTSLAHWSFWLVVGTLGMTLATLNRPRAVAALPVLLLICWFCVPNQHRYATAVGFVALPWVYRTLAVLARKHQVTIPSVVVLLALGVSAALTVPQKEEQPKFDLGPSARVYSEAPFATVFYGQPGIAVEPSFALGATRPQWHELRKDGDLSCALLLRGKFTHVVEKNLNHPLACATLTAVQGPWRLWTIKKD